LPWSRPVHLLEGDVSNAVGRTDTAFTHALARSFSRAVVGSLSAGEGLDGLLARWDAAIEKEDESIRDKLHSVAKSHCAKMQGENGE
jgi:hypothetical protein